MVYGGDAEVPGHVALIYADIRTCDGSWLLPVATTDTEEDNRNNLHNWTEDTSSSHMSADSWVTAVEVKEDMVLVRSAMVGLVAPRALYPGVGVALWNHGIHFSLVHDHIKLLLSVFDRIIREGQYENQDCSIWLTKAHWGLVLQAFTDWLKVTRISQ